MANAEGVDQETQEILDEIAAEQAPEEPAEEASEDSVEEPAEEVEASEPEQEEVEETEESDETEESKTERPVHYMPLSKHKKQKDKWQSKLDEKDSLIAELTSKLEEGTPVSSGDSDDIKSFVDKHGLDEDVVGDLLAIVQKRALPEDFREKFEKTTAQLEKMSASEFEKQQLDGFNKEFTALADEFPGAKSHKKRLQELAFSEEYQRTPLRMIFKGLDEFEGTGSTKKTAESGRGGAKKQMVDFKDVTPEDIKSMSDEDFDKYSEALAKGKSRLNFPS